MAAERESTPLGNPFAITKATDLRDPEIKHMWVDFHGEQGGFFVLADPRLPMPRLLVGGKGSGRTHLMRYFSAPLQALRSREAEGRVVDEGYLGIFYRASGLNSGRFAGKGVDEEEWRGIFAYYFDLTLAHRALETAKQTLADEVAFTAHDREIATALAEVFDDYPGQMPASTDDVLDTLRELQRGVDVLVNNAARTRELPVPIRVSRGRLPFAVPQAIGAHLPSEHPLMWLYLIDELENLSEPQQRYVQTLIREREDPASFMVGSRRYGLRTFRTYSAEEENKAGSEFEFFEMDSLYLSERRRFHDFCRNLVAVRLSTGGQMAGKPDEIASQVPGLFFQYPATPFQDAETRFVLKRGERPHLATLSRQLAAVDLGGEVGATIVRRLAVAEHPLLEKLNVFLLYQEWAARGHDALVDAAAGIARECRAYVEGHRPRAYSQSYRHWHADLLAQLLRQYDRPQRYLGFDAFVRMAGGLPRNLMVLLKRVFGHAIFDGNLVFEPGGIDEDAQRKGVLGAAEWFFREMTPPGPLGEDVQGAIDRLARLFRALRYADKPAEVSLVSFSVTRSQLTPGALGVLDAATQWSMLIAVPRGRFDRNTGGVREQYQLHPMLCPRWGLPLARRGDIALRKEEANAIFDPRCEEKVSEEFQRDRVRRLTAPFRNAGAQASLLEGEVP